MSGFNQFFGSLGILIYTKVGTYLYEVYGPQAPFLFVAALDAILLILMFILNFRKELEH